MSPKAPSPKRPPVPLPKAKAASQAKGITEEDQGAGTSASSAAESSHDVNALMAEAAKLLKGVSLKPLQVPELGEPLVALREFGLDGSWVRSAISSASDPKYALVDSGATNALRPATGKELSSSRTIKVDLASGVTQLHVNQHGTLLSASPCQVTIPAGYLVQLGFSILWKKTSCSMKRKDRQPLEVKVVKGCPLIPRDLGL